MRLGLSLGLAGVAGVRFYLPLIIIGLLTRFSETLSYHQNFRVFASVPVLLLLTALAGYEILSKRSGEAFDNHVFIMAGLKAISGAIVFAGLFEGIGTFLGLLVGAGISLSSYMTMVRLKYLYFKDAADRPEIRDGRFEETVAVAGTVLVLLLPWTSYFILGGILLAILKKIRDNNRYRTETTKARSWR